jgi:hypothetical protein
MTRIGKLNNLREWVVFKTAGAEHGGSEERIGGRAVERQSGGFRMVF